ncbi:MBL fold metallo-hydrolase [Pedobacter sp. L105]|uniref:MBL fold metallo-hydrolase n=1 Tax=Pedobacter sp. L105 TaxID=1641871 RepID=UPI00131CE1CA|nr:MBL fold metallo-hydrolase [Pedobacter sp. L105]
MTKPAQNNPSYYHLQIGDLIVTALSDGVALVEADKLLQSPEPGKILELLAAAHLDNPAELSINTYLVQIGSRLILIDTGAGELFGPDAGGNLLNSLQEAGYTPEQVTDVLLTHIHNDHSGGLTIQGKAVFPHATVHVHQHDADFWLDEERMKNADPNVMAPNQKSFINAINVFKPYLDAGRVKTFKGNIELFPGITSKECPGHTPGHTLFVIKSGDDQLTIWADLVHLSGIQFEDPTVLDGYDVDPKQGLAQRIGAYKDAAEKGYLVAGNHLSFPGFGRLRAKGSGYEWLPVAYSPSGRNR